MENYKNIEHLKQEALKNNGKKVYIWSDEGIKVNNKVFYMFEYGNMKNNFKGNCYITFRNEGHKGKGNRNNPIGLKDSFITIEYDLLYNKEGKTNDIFNFILIRDSF
jgi:hypothetical protein